MVNDQKVGDFPLNRVPEMAIIDHLLFIVVSDLFRRFLSTSFRHRGPIFGCGFSAQFRASRKTIYSPKPSTKLDAVWPNFPIDMTSERLILLSLSKK